MTGNIRIKESLEQKLSEYPVAAPEIINAVMKNIDSYKLLRFQHGRESAAYSFIQSLREITEKDRITSGRKITCKKGCSFCCYVHVPITDDEAYMIKKIVSERGIQIDRERLEKQAAHNLDNWKELKYQDRKCVFLDDNNECSIYDARPTTCVNYRVVTPKDQCNTEDDVKRGVLIVADLDADIMISALINVTNSDTLSKQLINIL